MSVQDVQHRAILTPRCMTIAYEDADWSRATASGAALDSDEELDMSTQPWEDRYQNQHRVEEDDEEEDASDDEAGATGARIKSLSEIGELEIPGRGDNSPPWDEWTPEKRCRSPSPAAPDSYGSAFSSPADEAAGVGDDGHVYASKYDANYKPESPNIDVVTLCPSTKASLAAEDEEYERWLASNFAVVHAWKYQKYTTQYGYGRTTRSMTAGDRTSGLFAQAGGALSDEDTPDELDPDEA